MAGLWEFPGGKVLPGETPEAALIRELKEELGLDITESCLAPFTFASHRYEDFHLLMPLFLCRVWDGTPVALEGQELKWVRPAIALPSGRLASNTLPSTSMPATGAKQDRGTGAGTPVVLVAAMALLDADGRVLLARRPEGKAMAGLWEFPGGKVLPGETPEAALIRELKEELGLDITESCLAPFTFASHRYEDFHLLMPLFLCRVWDGTPVALEGQELKWVRPGEMRNLAMPPADVPLVAMLRDFL